MKSRTKLTIQLIVIFSLLCAVLAVFCSGYQDSLRFAPTKAQKQTADLRDSLAAKINADGTDPGSWAPEKLCEGTQAAVNYMGSAKTPPAPENFDLLLHFVRGQVGCAQDKICESYLAENSV